MPRTFGSIGRATNDICTPCNYPAIMVVRESVTALATGPCAAQRHCPLAIAQALIPVPRSIQAALLAPFHALAVPGRLSYIK